MGEGLMSSNRYARNYYIRRDSFEHSVVRLILLHNRHNCDHPNEYTFDRYQAISAKILQPPSRF